MEIIGTIKGGFLIQATDSEIKEILNAVSGKRPEKIDVGQKIPAIDYASTITKIKSLSEDRYFKELIDYHSRFAKQIDQLKTVVENARKIES